MKEKPNFNPDDLVKSKIKEGEIELTENDLEQATGGSSDIFAKLGDIKGESLDDKHKGEIHVESFRTKP